MGAQSEWPVMRALITCATVLASPSALTNSTAFTVTGVTENPLLELNMYRSMKYPAEYPQANNNLADIPGTLQYVHREIIVDHRIGEAKTRTARKYDIDSIVAFRMLVKNPPGLNELGVFVTFDYGQATNSDHWKILQEHGDFVGKQRQNADFVRFVDPYYWFSVSGNCPNLPNDEEVQTSICTPQNPCLDKSAAMESPCLSESHWPFASDEKTKRCLCHRNQKITGGLCGTPGELTVPTGTLGCAYSYSQQSEVVKFDDIAGITQETCRSGHKCADYADFRKSCDNPKWRRGFFRKGDEVEVRTNLPYCIEYDLHPHCADSGCEDTRCLSVAAEERELGLPFWRGRCSGAASRHRAEVVAAALGVEAAQERHRVGPDPSHPDRARGCRLQSHVQMDCNGNPNHGELFCTRRWSGVCSMCRIPGTKYDSSNKATPYCPWDIAEDEGYGDLLRAGEHCLNSDARSICCLYSGTCTRDSMKSDGLDGNALAVLLAKQDTLALAEFFKRVASELFHAPPSRIEARDSALHQRAYWAWGLAPPKEWISEDKNVISVEFSLLAAEVLSILLAPPAAAPAWTPLGLAASPSPTLFRGSLTLAGTWPGTLGTLRQDLAQGLAAVLGNSTRVAIRTVRAVTPLASATRVRYLSENATLALASTGNDIPWPSCHIKADWRIGGKKTCRPKAVCDWDNQGRKCLWRDELRPDLGCPAKQCKFSKWGSAKCKPEAYCEQIEGRKACRCLLSEMAPSPTPRRRQARPTTRPSASTVPPEPPAPLFTTSTAPPLRSVSSTAAVWPQTTAPHDAPSRDEVFIEFEVGDSRPSLQDSEAMCDSSVLDGLQEALNHAGHAVSGIFNCSATSARKHLSSDEASFDVTGTLNLLADAECNSILETSTVALAHALRVPPARVAVKLECSLHGRLGFIAASPRQWTLPFEVRMLESEVQEAPPFASLRLREQVAAEMRLALLRKRLSVAEFRVSELSGQATPHGPPAVEPAGRGEGRGAPEPGEPASRGGADPGASGGHRWLVLLLLAAVAAAAAFHFNVHGFGDAVRARVSPAMPAGTGAPAAAKAAAKPKARPSKAHGIELEARTSAGASRRSHEESAPAGPTSALARHATLEELPEPASEATPVPRAAAPRAEAPANKATSTEAPKPKKDMVKSEEASTSRKEAPPQPKKEAPPPPKKEAPPPPKKEAPPPPKKEAAKAKAKAAERPSSRPRASTASTSETADASKGKTVNWADKFQSPDPCEVIEAAEAVSTMGPEAMAYVKLLIDNLADNDRDVRRAVSSAIVALGAYLGEGVRKVATLAVTSPKPSVREVAIETMVKLGPSMAPAADLLESATKDDRHEIRIAAVQILGQLSHATAGQLDALAACLQDPNWTVRKQASSALAAHGRAAKPYLQKLDDLRDDEDEDVQIAAARAAERIRSS